MCCILQLMGQADLIKHFPQVALDAITGAINKLSKKVSELTTASLLPPSLVLGSRPAAAIAVTRHTCLIAPPYDMTVTEPDPDDGHGCQGDQVEGRHKERGEEVSLQTPPIGTGHRSRAHFRLTSLPLIQDGSARR